ncbi:MAG: sigma-70 family RNA polymerase sigma factor [Phycisphaeraceae bacterium]|nr:sigma-70 family RNA polymerase sigma factor [Phycisphaeraceae bacterium]
MPSASTPNEELTDADLMRQYQAGQSDAFAALVERYRKPLFYFLQRYVRDPSTADDLFQETFLQVHRSADSFDPDRRLKPWLFTIAANKARDYLRRTQRRKTLSLSRSVGSDGEASFVDLMEGDLPDPGEDLEESETAERVRDVAGKLPEDYREILLLAYFQQFPYRQIAEILDIPLGTVKSRLHAAVKAFAGLWHAENGPLSSPPEKKE